MSPLPVRVPDKAWQVILAFLAIGALLAELMQVMK